VDERPVAEHLPTFADGYRAAVVCDAILASAEQGRRVAVDEARWP
jgi:predicted dehydrogenase